MRSMTGFVTKNVVLSLEDGTKAHIVITIKSLNARFFEVTSKISYPLSNLETQVNTLLKDYLVRGHIYFTIFTGTPHAFKSLVEPSLSAVKDYLNAVELIQKTYNIPGSLTIENILGLPNIFNVAEKTLDDTARNLVLTETEALLKELVMIQEKEGSNLKIDIQERIRIMGTEIEHIEKASALLMDTRKSKISKTLQDIEQATEETKTQELHKYSLYTILDKMDIHEEIIRFKTHLKSLVMQLDSSAREKGKRIDFTLQELAREINTITAKCSDATIGTSAINVKVEIEKAREQVQNII